MCPWMVKNFTGKTDKIRISNHCDIGHRLHDATYMFFNFHIFGFQISHSFSIVRNVSVVKYRVAVLYIYIFLLLLKYAIELHPY